MFASVGLEMACACLLPLDRCCAAGTIAGRVERTRVGVAAAVGKRSREEWKAIVISMSEGSWPGGGGCGCGGGVLCEVNYYGVCQWLEHGATTGALENASHSSEAKVR